MKFQIKKQQQTYPGLLLQFPSVEQRFLKKNIFLSLFVVTFPTSAVVLVVYAF